MANSLDELLNMAEKEFEKVEVGDIILCHDEYALDYNEHEFLVTSIEEDDGNIVLLGDDLSTEKDEQTQEYISDNYIRRVDIGNFEGIKEKHADISKRKSEAEMNKE